MKRRHYVFFILIFFYLSINVISPRIQANAYELQPSTWPSDTIHYTFEDLTPTDEADAVMAIANVKNAQANFNLVYGSGDIYYYSVNYGPNGEWGDVFGLCKPFDNPPGTCDVMKIYINNYYTDDKPRQGRQMVIAHETLHALCLDDNPYRDIDCLMYNSYELTYDERKIFVPLYDDIRGLQELYYRSPFTEKDSDYTSTKGHIDHGVVQGYPERLWIDPPGNNQYASTFEERRYLPSSGTIYMIGKVKSDIQYKYAMGIFTGVNQFDRMMTIQMGRSIPNKVNFFKLKKTSGSTQTKPICYGIEEGKYYYLFLVVQNGLSARAYITDSSGHMLGTAALSLSDSWDTQVRLGSCVWTKFTKHPPSDYTTERWYNKMCN